MHAQDRRGFAGQIVECVDADGVVPAQTTGILSTALRMALRSSSVWPVVPIITVGTAPRACDVGCDFVEAGDNGVAAMPRIVAGIAGGLNGVVGFGHCRWRRPWRAPLRRILRGIVGWS